LNPEDLDRKTLHVVELVRTSPVPSLHPSRVDELRTTVVCSAAMLSRSGRWRTRSWGVVVARVVMVVVAVVSLVTGLVLIDPWPGR